MISAPVHSLQTASNISIIYANIKASDVNIYRIIQPCLNFKLYCTYSAVVDLVQLLMTGYHDGMCYTIALYDHESSQISLSPRNYCCIFIIRINL